MWWCGNEDQDMLLDSSSMQDDKEDMGGGGKNCGDDAPEVNLILGRRRLEKAGLDPWRRYLRTCLGFTAPLPTTRFFSASSLTEYGETIRLRRRRSGSVIDGLARLPRWGDPRASCLCIQCLGAYERTNPTHDPERRAYTVEVGEAILDIHTR